MTERRAPHCSASLFTVQSQTEIGPRQPGLRRSRLNDAGQQIKDIDWEKNVLWENLWTEGENCSKRRLPIIMSYLF